MSDQSSRPPPSGSWPPPPGSQPPAPEPFPPPPQAPSVEPGTYAPEPPASHRPEPGDRTPTQPPEGGPGRDSKRPGSEPPGRGRGRKGDYEYERSPFERIVPELLKRGIEASRGVSDTLFSRDIANNLVSQLGEMREGVVNAVAHEVGRFLRQADIAAELRNVLTGMEVEAKLKIKFKQATDGGVEAKIDVEEVQRKDRRRRQGDDG